MEDQGKRLIIAVVAAVGIFFVWQQLFPSKKEEPPANGSGSASGQVQTSPGAPGAPAAASNAPVIHPRAAADELVVDAAEVHAVFSKWGGNVVSWRLKDERYATTAEKGELITGAPPFGRGAFDLNFTPESSTRIPGDAEWTGKVAGDVVTYTFSDDKLTVTKTYTLFPKDYLLKLDVSVEAKKGAEGQPTPAYSQWLSLSAFAYQDAAKIVKAGRTTREWSVACFTAGSVEDKPINELQPLWTYASASWAGLSHPYYLFAMAPRMDANDAPVRCDASPSATTKGAVQVSLVYAPASIKGGEAAFHREIWTYAGPKYLEKLESADDVAKFKTHFQDSVSLGWFGIIGRPLLWLLLQFYDLVHNWGIAIILLTLLVKLATLYWTTKSMRSMRAMAALKPKMDELNAKYKDDRARQQQEMMALYKTHGVNPLAGCLPILLQMPIWLALYKMLSTAGQLYNAPFIPGWIDDLTDKDPYYILGVALVILMFVQARLQPATGDSMQQKMMMYGLPAVFGVMSLVFPSGLTLYILTNTMLTSLHTLYMRKFDKSAKLVAAVKPAAPASPRGGSDKPKASAPAKVSAPIDVEGDERIDEDDRAADDDDGDSDDGDDDGGKAPASKTAASKSQKNANKSRRGKNRRGRN